MAALEKRERRTRTRAMVAVVKSTTTTPSCDTVPGKEEFEDEKKVDSGIIASSDYETIVTGGLYVGISTLQAISPSLPASTAAPPAAAAATVKVHDEMLGLFAGRNYKKGELMCEYGGELLTTHGQQEEKDRDHDWFARIPDSNFLYDGSRLSRLFDRSPELSSIVNVPRRKRHAIGGNTERKLAVEGSGIGYMANTHADRSKLNAILATRFPGRKNKTLLTQVLLKSSRPIYRDEEIFLKYNNPFHRSLMATLKAQRAAESETVKVQNEVAVEIDDEEL